MSVYWKVTNNILYFSSTSSDGYTEYTGGRISGLADITEAVFENQCIMPQYCNNLFGFCSFLTKITNIEYMNTKNVVDMQSMFWGCMSLQNLDVSNFKTSKLQNASEMFSCCSALESLDLSNWDTQSLTNTYSMFYECNSLKTLNLTNFKTNLVTDMRNMFQKCYSLTKLDLSSFNTDSLTMSESMFAGCSSISSLDLSNFNTKNVTNTESMFCGMSSLTSINVSSFDVSNVTYMSGMFCGCSNLKELDLRSFNPKSVGSIGYIFQDDSELETIWASDWCDIIPDIPGANREYMFLGCVNLPNYTAEVVNYKAAHDASDERDPAGYFNKSNLKLCYGDIEIDNNYKIIHDSEQVAKVFKKKRCFWKG